MDNLRDAWKKTEAGEQYSDSSANISLNEAWKLIESGQYEIDEGFDNAVVLAQKLADVLSKLGPQQATQIMNMLNQSLGG